MDHIKWETEYSALPETLRAEMLHESAYYSAEYNRLEAKRGCSGVYFYNEAYVWVVFLKRKFVFRYANVPVEYARRKVPQMHSATEFLNEAVHVLKTEFRLHWIGPTRNQALFMEIPTGCRWIPFGSHVVDLTQTEEELWKRVHSKHRNVIRRAEKDGLIIRKGTEPALVEAYAKLDAQTWSRSNMKSDVMEEVERLLRDAPEHTVLYLIEKEGEPQGGAVFFYSEKMSYYLYGASKNSPSLGAMNELHWRAMLDMKAAGVKSYSFVGCRINEDPNSKYHSLQRFKERFGGPVQEGRMFKCILNQTMYRWYCRLLYLKNNKGKAYPVDIIEQEHDKWHSKGKSTM